jgi:hypothetical protein
LPKQEIGPASSWNKEKNGTSLNITADNHQKEYMLNPFRLNRAWEKKLDVSFGELNPNFLLRRPH